MSKVRIATQEYDLRRGVDYIGVSVNFVIHDGKGSVLLQKRSKNCRDEQGRWDVGGGSMEFGETLEEAVKREVKEELRAKALQIDFLKAYAVVRDNKGTKTHWVAFMHAVRVDPKRVAIGEPHKIDEIGWFNSKNLPSPLHSQFDKTFGTALELGFAI